MSITAPQHAFSAPFQKAGEQPCVVRRIDRVAPPPHEKDRFQGIACAWIIQHGVYRQRFTSSHLGASQFRDERKLRPAARAR